MKSFFVLFWLSWCRTEGCYERVLKQRMKTFLDERLEVSFIKQRNGWDEEGWEGGNR